ncbi:MAG: hypothetical protein LBM93_04240, partial [Oscillospiraceae bacterium]|nr:hypothetical protein [Oscillospiraceae bacterium]
MKGKIFIISYDLKKEVINIHDKDLIALFLQRNNSAIYETQQKYSRFLRSIAINILKNKEDAEEVVNDTLMKVWQSIP